MIRRYGETDVDALVSVWRIASDLAHPFLSREFQDSEAENVRSVYPQFAEIWVKELKGEVIGFVALIESEVGAIFLLPAYHGRGIGRELMDFAVARIGRVTLEVFKQNTIGRKFYDKYGFLADGERLHEPSGHVAIRMTFKPTSV